MSKMVVGKFNKSANTMLKNVIEKKLALDAIYIFGETGTGKTYLIEALVNSQKYLDDRKSILTFQANTLMKLIVDNVKSERSESLEKLIGEQVKLLIIDSIEDLAKRHGTQLEVLRLCERVQRNGGAVVLAGAENEFLPEYYAKEFVSFIRSGGCVEIGHPDEPARVKLVKQIAKELDLKIDKGVKRHIAKNTSSMTSIKCFLNKIKAYFSVHRPEQVKIIIEDVREMLIKELELEKLELIKKIASKVKFIQSVSSMYYRPVWRVYDKDGVLLESLEKDFKDSLVENMASPPIYLSPVNFRKVNYR